MMSNFNFQMKNVSGLCFKSIKVPTTDINFWCNFRSLTESQTQYIEMAGMKDIPEQFTVKTFPALFGGEEGVRGGGAKKGDTIALITRRRRIDVKKRRHYYSDKQTTSDWRQYDVQFMIILTSRSQRQPDIFLHLRMTDEGPPSFIWGRGVRGGEGVSQKKEALLYSSLQ